MQIGEFKEQFKFQEEKKGYVGTEREFFLTRRGIIVPLAQEVLEHINDAQCTYELSACQLESRTEPCQIEKLHCHLVNCEKVMVGAERKLQFERSHKSVAPFDMPLDVFPDPSGRYGTIARTISVKVLRSACRIIGTHVHIGMPDHETALRVYSGVIQKTDELCKIGDNSRGERMKLYKDVTPEYMPRAYTSWEDFQAEMIQRGCESDPRSVWTLIRISVHGTIEFRMFDATSRIEQIVEWAHTCHALCEKYIE